MKKLISLILINTLLISCTKTEYIEVDVKPKLEILVTDINNNPISGANVSLFITEEDFNSKQNLIKTSKKRSPMKQTKMRDKYHTVKHSYG